MTRGLGPRADFVYRALRASILDGTFTPGSRLPAHSALALRFDVAVMTVRQACARLEHEGLIVSRQGRGTFVRSRTVPAILIVDGDAAVRALLARHVERAGYRAAEVADADEGIEALDRDPAIVL